MNDNTIQIRLLLEQAGGLGQFGLSVEALRTGLDERKFMPAEVLRAARVCRVGRIVRPYLEALQ